MFCLFVREHGCHLIFLGTFIINMSKKYLIHMRIHHIDVYVIVNIRAFNIFAHLPIKNKKGNC